MSSKDKLIKILQNHIVQKENIKISFKMALISPLAEHLIKNDIVPVIRCKACRYYNHRWGCRKLEINVSLDNYCFMAEPAISDNEVILADEK